MTRSSSRSTGTPNRSRARLLGCGRRRLPGVPTSTGPGGFGVLHARAVGAALTGGAHATVTVRMNSAVKKAISTIGDDAWTPIGYTAAIFDEDTGRWILRAEVAETSFTAFASAKEEADGVPGRLMVRRIPDFTAEARRAAGHDIWGTARLWGSRWVAVPRVLHHDGPGAPMAADHRSRRCRTHKKWVAPIPDVRCV